MSVIIHGPQACGKTRNAKSFARAFRCRTILDDWDGHSPVPAGTLVLTNEEPPFKTNATVMSFTEACRLTGVA